MGLSMEPNPLPRTYRAGPPLTYPSRSVFSHIFPDQSSISSSLAFIDADTNTSLTRAEVYSLSLQLAYAFRNLSTLHAGPDLREGDAVLLFSPNHLLYPIVLLAGFAAGTPVAAASSASVPAELVNALKLTKCAFYVVHPALVGVFEAAMRLMGRDKEEYAPRTVLLSQSPSEAMEPSYGSIFSIMHPAKKLEPVRFDDDKASETAVYWFSSGTTGLPKAIECSHRAIVAQGEGTKWWVPLSEGDVVAIPLPLFHVAGGMLGLFFPLIARHPSVFWTRGFVFDSMLSGITKYRPSVIITVPPIITGIVRHPKVTMADWSKTKMVLTGAAPVRPHELEMTYERLKPIAHPELRVYQTHGMSETCCITKANRNSWSTKWGSIGVPTPGVEIKLVTEDGRDAELNEPGELWERGDMIMRAYYGNPKATTETLTADGWLKTGDVCTMDEDGHLYVVDRRKELIKYKGYQVAPAELEAILTTHPDIFDSGVIGVMSPTSSLELPKAFVVPRNPSLLASKLFPQEICEWIKPKVSHYKALRGGVTLVPAIPRSPSGKILRGQLRTLEQQLSRRTDREMTLQARL